MTISAWIMRRQDGEVKALVHRHRKLHIWLQPGGHIEHTENPWQALAHELREETGYELSQLRVLQALPVVEGCEINDDPYAPVCVRCRSLAVALGDELPIEWQHRDEQDERNPEGPLGHPRLRVPPAAEAVADAALGAGIEGGIGAQTRALPRDSPRMPVGRNIRIRISRTKATTSRQPVPNST